ncbi:DNA modification methylase [[Clostridium] sordellii]|uniref:DNA-methyltransferase n=1 Tax=Paraclostridium sordellii TaxID=1505 RepID=UPI0005E4E0F5|nr:site-specific DNA-methyltransferase [Paeniclostridium sordellii]CEP39595.1 DNA modification methylase [[Clostridium] sordellii] [Paeniclostridium sordellii]
MEKIRNYNLYNGDCIEIMKNIKSESIDLILCDLPFEITKCDWDKMIPFDELWEQYNRILKKNGVIVLFSVQPFTTKLIFSNIKNYKYSWYWIKNKPTGFAFAKYQPMRRVEDINVFYKTKPLYKPQGLIELSKPKVRGRSNRKETGIFGKNLLQKDYVSKYTNYPNNVLYFDKESKTVHPTQKPHDLLSYLIKTYTKEGDLILDNCMGGGSTGVAAAETKRRFIGIELDNNFFEIAKNRIVRAYMEAA